MQRLRITPFVHMAAHQSSCILMMHIMQLLKLIDVTLEQTPRELSVPLSMISPLGELPFNGVS